MPDISPKQEILWSGTVGFNLTTCEYVDAAAGAGLPLLSLSLDGVAQRDKEGSSLHDVRTYASDHGVAISVLDGLLSWMPLGDTRLAARSPSVRQALDAATSIGATSLNALVIKSELSNEALAEHFASACALADEVGCQIIVEFSPIGGAPDVTSAWEIVRLAGQPNSGILFDTWHFFRGAADFDALRSIPGDRIMAVQISDAATNLNGSLWNDTIHHRRLPGTGSFDLEQAIQVLDSMGALRCVGPEVLSDELNTLTPIEAAQAAASSVDSLLERALSSRP
jgi:sugar phosphate isomerase/epimerase